MTGYQAKRTWALQQLLTREFEKKEPALILRAAKAPGGVKPVICPANARFFIATLEDHLFHNTRSVVLTIEADEEAFLLRFCCPIEPEAYHELAALGYAPPLRPRWNLRVGVRPEAYAYAAVKLSPRSGVMDFFDALHVLGRELETFLMLGEGGADHAART